MTGFDLKLFLDWENGHVSEYKLQNIKKKFHLRQVHIALSACISINNYQIRSKHIRIKKQV